MYPSLVAGYACALAALVLVAWRSERLWPRATATDGMPLRYTLLLLVAVVGIGLLSQRGMLIPAGGSWSTLAHTANQVLIFSPVFVAVVVAQTKGSQRSRDVALLPADHVGIRLAVGVFAAAVALVAYHAAAGALDRLPTTISSLLSARNVPYLPQILGEDLAIALLLASLLRVVRPRTAIIATGLLFALGHVPAMLTRGEAVTEFVRLVADGLLAAGVVAVLLRMRDVWTIWPIHVAMDLMQFAGPK